MMDTSTLSRSNRPVGAAINASTDRCAMGFPEHYLPTRYEAPIEVYLRLASVSTDGLVERMEDIGVPLADRIGAGRLLALRGDPRIDPFGPVMINIPGGRAILGLDREHIDRVTSDLADTGVIREWIEKESPTYSVTIAPYRIGKYQVTNLEYRVFLAETRFCELPTSWEFGRYPHEKANVPVYTVSERAADAYVVWLADRTGRRFRLPREAEWEFAAAGPDRCEYPWGESFDPERANTLESGLLCATPVGTFPNGMSPFGVSDMAGNVEEYVSDVYSAYPGAPPIEDDLARSRGVYRVARGGSFTRYRDLARCKRRHGFYPKAIYAMGFRLAEDI